MKRLYLLRLMILSVVFNLNSCNSQNEIIDPKQVSLIEIEIFDFPNNQSTFRKRIVDIRDKQEIETIANLIDLDKSLYQASIAFQLATLRTTGYDNSGNEIFSFDLDIDSSNGTRITNLEINDNYKIQHYDGINLADYIRPLLAEKYGIVLSR